MLDGIFNYDNKFFRAVNKLADLVILSFCWLISCIPIFTIGAASSALYSAVHKSIRRGKGYVWSGYWSAFRRDFKQATKAWLIMLLIIIVVTSDILITTQMLKAGMSMGNLSIVFIVMECIIVACYAYTFAYIARFEQTTKLTLKNSFVILIANLPWTFLVIVILLAAVMIAYLIPLFIIILPAASVTTLEVIFEKIFRKFMTPEDLKKEQEEDKMDID